MDRLIEAGSRPISAQKRSQGSQAGPQSPPGGFHTGRRRAHAPRRERERPPISPGEALDGVWGTAPTRGGEMRPTPAAPSYTPADRARPGRPPARAAASRTGRPPPPHPGRPHGRLVRGPDDTNSAHPRRRRRPSRPPRQPRRPAEAAGRTSPPRRVRSVRATRPRVSPLKAALRAPPNRP